MRIKNKKTAIYAIISIFFLAFLFYFVSPKKLFAPPYCTVITDEHNNLLAAHIADDGQWRFPYNDSVPYKFKKSILYFEDRFFYFHPGINPLAIVRASWQNIKAKKVVSGGSTISSQVIRLSRQGKRTIYEKAIEFSLAIMLEVRYSKNEILAMYTSNAPFGGNVVGLDAAAWRYFGRSANKLSWGESATLAVLPNAPSLIYPGKNHEKLLKKRNRLLDKLYKNKVIDKEICELSKFEPLPQKPKPLPKIAPHLLTHCSNNGLWGKRITSTIDLKTQEQAIRVVKKHHSTLSQNGIENAAVLVINVKQGKVLAYVGNTNSNQKESGKYVDIITAPRSTGSTIKPILYGLLLQNGSILPHTIIADIPTNISGYTPKNFNKKYLGAVPASNALARSLNVPAVRMLQGYGLERFLDNLNQLNLTTFNKPADHYGLSLILGGAETTLWELSGLYASLARLLNNFQENNSKYNLNDFHNPYFNITDAPNSKPKLYEHFHIGAGSIWLTFEALTEMNRPIEDASWKRFESSKKIAWKTGTSFGHRDAWAVGITPEYVVGVWVGNANGQGRPGLTGAVAAAPIMFDVFKTLPQTTWFNTPYDDLTPISICKQSGYKAGNFCTETDTILCALNGYRTIVCPYHKLVHLDKNEKFQVNSSCYSVSDMVQKKWFVLPPTMEYFYKNNNPFYKTLPPFLPICDETQTENIEFIYPKQYSKVFIPRGFNKQKQRVVFEITHRLPNTKVHWHLDNIFLITTQQNHKTEVFAKEGKHYITLVDELGETKTLFFEVLSR